MGDALGDAAKGHDAVQTTATDNEKIGVGCSLYERLYGMSFDGLRERCPQMHLCEVDAFTVERADHAQRAAEPRGELPGGGEGVVGLGRAVEADDKSAGEGRGRAWSRDQDRAGRLVEQLAGNPADQDLGCSSMLVRAECEEGGVEALELVEQGGRDEAVEMTRVGAAAEDLDCAPERFLGLLCEDVDSVNGVERGSDGGAEMDDGDRVDRRVRPCEAGYLAARVEAGVGAVDADEDAGEDRVDRGWRGRSASLVRQRMWGSGRHGSAHRGVRSMRRSCEKGGAGDQTGEGRELERALGAIGKLFSEDDEAGGDRDGVGGKRREAGAGECIAVLEGTLQDAGPERVADDEAADGDEPDAAVDDEFCGDVAGGEEQPGSEAQCSPSGEADAELREREGADGRAAEPQKNRSPTRRMVGLSGVDEGEREQDESAERDRYRELLMAGEPSWVAMCARYGEHGDARGADGLHECDRGDPKRGDVHDPAPGLRCESRQPPSVAEQE